MSPGMSFQLVSSIWEEWRTFTTFVLFCHVHKLFVCNFLKLLVILFFLSLVSFQYFNVCQNRKFDLKVGQGSCAMFLISVSVCVLFHEWIPLPVFHASVCLGSHILAARWRHQSRIWNCSKSQALGQFVICYITYPASKVSLESTPCFMLWL